MEPFPEPGLFTTCMRVYIQGGTLKLLLPIPEPSQNITWLKNDFKLRALRRGKDVTVEDVRCNGRLLHDDDVICHVITDQAVLSATGLGIETVASEHPQAPAPPAVFQPPPPQPPPDERKKRKYARGGHKKLKLVAPILESYLPEMATTSEKDRQKFYAKIVALPQMILADVNRDEVVSWYKRARKKCRNGEDIGSSPPLQLDEYHQPPDPYQPQLQPPQYHPQQQYDYSAAGAYQSESSLGAQQHQVVAQAPSVVPPPLGPPPMVTVHSSSIDMSSMGPAPVMGLGSEQPVGQLADSFTRVEQQPVGQLADPFTRVEQQPVGQMADGHSLVCDPAAMPPPGPVQYEQPQQQPQQQQQPPPPPMYEQPQHEHPQQQGGAATPPLYEQPPPPSQQQPTLPTHDHGFFPEVASGGPCEGIAAATHSPAMPEETAFYAPAAAMPDDPLPCPEAAPQGPHPFLVQATGGGAEGSAKAAEGEGMAVIGM